MGRRDSGPTQGGASLARHFRHGGGRRQSLRRSGLKVQGKQSQTQLPWKCQIHTTTAATSPELRSTHQFKFYAIPFGAKPIRTTVSATTTTTALPVSSFSGLYSISHWLLGLLSLASELHWHSLPTTAAHEFARADVLQFAISFTPVLVIATTTTIVIHSVFYIAVLCFFLSFISSVFLWSAAAGFFRGAAESESGRSIRVSSTLLVTFRPQSFIFWLIRSWIICFFHFIY